MSENYDPGTEEVVVNEPVADTGGAPQNEGKVSTERTVQRSVPAGFLGGESKAVATRSPLRRPQLKGDHRPLGSQVRRTADWDDATRTWYPTRSNPAKVDSDGKVVTDGQGKAVHELSAKDAVAAGVFPDPGQMELTPTRFHPLELPDPQAAFDAQLYPQMVPAYQVDPNHETHSLTGHVEIDNPVRQRNRP